MHLSCTPSGLVRNTKIEIEGCRTFATLNVNIRNITLDYSSIVSLLFSRLAKRGVSDSQWRRSNEFLEHQNEGCDLPLSTSHGCRRVLHGGKACILARHNNVKTTKHELLPEGTNSYHETHAKNESDCFLVGRPQKGLQVFSHLLYVSISFTSMSNLLKRFSVNQCSKNHCRLALHEHRF